MEKPTLARSLAPVGDAGSLVKEEWLKTFRELPNGIPSHDTFGRVFSRLDPEIKAIPILLEQLDLKGAIITTDAMGTQTAIAQQIQEAEADYILALKANHPSLAENARNWLEKHKNEQENPPFSKTELTCEAGHHRLEKRRFFSVPVEQVFSTARIKQWSGLQTLVIEESSRTLWNKTTHSLRFFLSSLKPEFPDFPTSIRSHWGVENQLHWCLDVLFQEDDSRIRKDHAPRNMSILSEEARRGFLGKRKSRC